MQFAFVTDMNLSLGFDRRKARRQRTEARLRQIHSECNCSGEQVFRQGSNTMLVVPVKQSGGKMDLALNQVSLTPFADEKIARMPM